MRAIYTSPSEDSNARATPHSHPDSLREGAMLGLIVATATWMWVVAIDAVAGDPFRAFTMLGGVAIFTAMHLLLNVVYGVAIVSVIHRADRAPSVIIGLIFCFIIIEIAFAMVTIFLSNLGMGELAWLRIFGGSLVGGLIAFGVLQRRHPLALYLHRAEAEV
jgi:hypothetical protein